MDFLAAAKEKQAKSTPSLPKNDFLRRRLENEINALYDRLAQALKAENERLKEENKILREKMIDYICSRTKFPRKKLTDIIDKKQDFYFNAEEALKWKFIDEIIDDNLPETEAEKDDIKKLLVILQRIVDNGDTVIVIEHNLDVIKVADYIIDLGPEGGDKGGTLVACGTPEEVAKVKASYTGQYVKQALAQAKKNRWYE